MPILGVAHDVELTRRSPSHWARARRRFGGRICDLAQTVRRRTRVRKGYLKSSSTDNPVDTRGQRPQDELSILDIDKRYQLHYESCGNSFGARSGCTSCTTLPAVRYMVRGWPRNWLITAIGSARGRSTPPCTRWKPKDCLPPARCRRPGSPLLRERRPRAVGPLESKVQLRELARRSSAKRPGERTTRRPRYASTGGRGDGHRVPLGHDRQGMGPARVHWLRRSTHPHRHAPTPLCRRTGLDRGGGVRGRHRDHQPPARARVDPAGHLLRLAAPGPDSAPSSAGCASSSRGSSLILALSAVFLAGHPPDWILGAAAGAGAAVPAVALNAAWTLVPASWVRIGRRAGRACPLGRLRRCWAGPPRPRSAVPGARPRGLRPDRDRRPRAAADFPGRPGRSSPPSPATLAAAGGLGALAWVALKVGALSYGGGFVIVPLMQHDAVTTYHWMTGAQFLNAVALGQVTPGPVVQTVAVVGYAAGGVGGGLLAALIAFAPSFAFVLSAVRTSTGSGPTAPSSRSSPGRTGGHRRHRRLGHPARARPWPPLADPRPGPRCSGCSSSAGASSSPSSVPACSVSLPPWLAPPSPTRPRAPAPAGLSIFPGSQGSTDVDFERPRTSLSAAPAAPSTGLTISPSPLTLGERACVSGERATLHFRDAPQIPVPLRRSEGRRPPHQRPAGSPGRHGPRPAHSMAHIWACAYLDRHRLSLGGAESSWWSPATGPREGFGVPLGRFRGAVGNRLGNRN